MSRKSARSKSSKKSRNQDKQDNSTSLPGWPGYRTREGRSGYDPIDTRTEAAHTAGTLIQKLFTGHTRNPVYLFLSAVLGMVLITPLVLALSEIMNGTQLPWSGWLFILITGVAGLAILVNFIRNLIQSLTR